MQISILYCEGCPNWYSALEDVKEVIAEYYVDAVIEAVQVTSQDQAEELEFLGSPTVRVDGMDVEPDLIESGFSLDYRTYWLEDDPLSRPPKEWIAAAIEVALE